MASRYLYLLATNTKKPVARMIRTVTGEKFNHASIAFDEHLTECYSFNIGQNGFVREFKEEWPAWTEFALYRVRVSEAGLRAAREYVGGLLASAKKTSFSFAGLFGVAINVPIERQFTLFCSEFVERTCVAAGLPPSAESSGLATPGPVCARAGAKLVASGLLHQYLFMKATDDLSEGATEILLNL